MQVTVIESCLVFDRIDRYSLGLFLAKRKMVAFDLHCDRIAERRDSLDFHDRPGRGAHVQ